MNTNTNPGFTQDTYFRYKLKFMAYGGEIQDKTVQNKKTYEVIVT
jgi:hypothetical protein